MTYITHVVRLNKILCILLHHDSFILSEYLCLYTFFSFSDELPSSSGTSLKPPSFLLENQVHHNSHQNCNTMSSQNNFDLEKKCDETSGANLNSWKLYSRVLNNFAEHFPLFDLNSMIFQVLKFEYSPDPTTNFVLLIC